MGMYIYIVLSSLLLVKRIGFPPGCRDGAQLLERLRTSYKPCRGGSSYYFDCGPFLSEILNPCIITLTGVAIRGAIPITVKMTLQKQKIRF